MTMTHTRGLFTWPERALIAVGALGALMALVGGVMAFILTISSPARGDDADMATPVSVSTTMPAPVPVVPTESSAITPVANGQSCTTALDRERARVAHLRTVVARLRANR